MFRDQVIAGLHRSNRSDMGKVEYEGTLDQLLENDIDKFIEYNLVDVKIVVALEEKLKLIDLVVLYLIWVEYLMRKCILVLDISRVYVDLLT